MKAVRLLIFGVVALQALPLLAFLPPDAEFRQKEIIQNRMRARAEYEQQQKDYGQAVVASRIRMQAAMEKPPWMRKAGNKAVAGDELFRPAQSAAKINHRFLVSIVLLILIGVGAGLVRYKTRKLDG